MKTYTSLVSIGWLVILGIFLALEIPKEKSLSQVVLEESLLGRESYVIENKEILKEGVRKEVYDGLTMDELTAKLDRYLTSDLSGKGYIYAARSLEIGLDPYLAVAVSMHETGCKWGCSYLTTACYNVGGQKGAPGCNGGPYQSYPTLDDGIIGFIDNLYFNYVAKGLTTPEEINTRYAEDPYWASKINRYINEIKNI